MRKIISLNDNWKYIKKAEDANTAVSAQGQSVNLPHTWNDIDGQDGGNDYYRGTCWYVKTLDKPPMNVDDRVYLEFLGAAMTATVYINDKQVITH